MAAKPKPAWVAEVKKKLATPYTPEEMERIRKSFEIIDRLNAEHGVDPPGTFQRLLDMAHAEDEEDERAARGH